MFEFVHNPDFWVGYWIVAALYSGVQFFLIGRHTWYQNWNPYEAPGLIRVLATIGMSAIFPITLAGYAAFVISELVQMVSDWKESRRKANLVVKQQHYVHCCTCTAAILKTDSFCSLCGADQNVWKKAGE